MMRLQKCASVPENLLFFPQPEKTAATSPILIGLEAERSVM
jgi:hypothetical protein